MRKLAVTSNEDGLYGALPLSYEDRSRNMRFTYGTNHTPKGAATGIEPASSQKKRRELLGVPNFKPQIRHRESNPDPRRLEVPLPYHWTISEDCLQFETSILFCSNLLGADKDWTLPPRIPLLLRTVFRKSILDFPELQNASRL